jgi:hypothetical protein
MEELLELIKLFAIGAIAGILYGVIVRRNKYKENKEKKRNMKD